ncbi:hypothetical protein [Streptomyces boncukensis]|uniref:Uncharacterized protein n=1 Tax=Streptomyces boncukensis TaxID=2711219 RepID=A0A6G4WW32_9ACTN|nr:hypothetical protein [Streptomyces boncukensis]NGO68744.1 hypothetical protein [Streptomyces boncukensis]
MHLSRQREHRRRGLAPLRPTLAQAVDGGETPLTVAEVDWTRFTPAFTSGRPGDQPGDGAPD